jgi:hypothetical protein
MMRRVKAISYVVVIRTNNISRFSFRIQHNADAETEPAIAVGDAGFVIRQT